MENTTSISTHLHAFFNKNERVQVQLVGNFAYVHAETKGTLFATNERICFYAHDDSAFLTFDYYEIDAVILHPDEVIFYNQGERHILSDIEQGNVEEFNQFVIDRMQIKS